MIGRVGRRARQFLNTYYALMLEFRAEIFLWVLTGSMPLIMMGIWTRAAASGAFAVDAAHMGRYFLAVFIVRQFTIVWVIWEFERLVVEGSLSSHLLKPIDPVWGLIAMHISEQLTRAPFWIIIAVLMLIVYPDTRWHPQPLGVILAVIALGLAFTLRFVLQYTFAMLSFWIERASSIEQVSFLPYMFLSGYIAPLSVYPPAVREFALWTPFPYLVNFQAQLLIDPSAPDFNIPRGFAIMLAWIAGLFIINRWLWRRGLAEYSGMGA